MNSVIDVSYISSMTSAWKRRRVQALHTFGTGPEYPNSITLSDPYEQAKTLEHSPILLEVITGSW